MAPDVNLGRFFKGTFGEDPDAALQALMRAILIRTQFLPAVRHVIGWRGLKQSSAGVEGEGWTAKIRDYAGVFGKGILEFSDSPQPMLFQYVAGRFELTLFPQPAVTDRFLTVIARGGDAPEGFFSDIESLMARPDA